MSHDYPNIARQLLQSLGGSDNLEQAAHCVTRLRLALKDPSLVDSARLNQIDLVKGSFFTGGLYQVVIGPGEVEKVYAELRRQTGLAASTIADVKQKSAEKINAIMADTAAMAFRLNKPLTVRLFPVPGLNASDITRFTRDDL